MTTTRSALRLFFVPLTLGGFGNTADCYVLAEDGLNAKAAAIMAGITLEPGAFVAAGIPREHTEIPAGRCVAVPAAAPEGARVWNFGTGARARMTAARREGRIVRRDADLDWWKLAA
jgi:hypothetical protein